MVTILFGANGSVAQDISKNMNRTAKIPKAMSEPIVKESDQDMFPPLSRPNIKKKTVRTRVIAPPISIRLMLAEKLDLLVSGRWRVSATEAIANMQIGTCIKNALFLSGQLAKNDTRSNESYHRQPILSVKKPPIGAPIADPVAKMTVSTPMKR